MGERCLHVTHDLAGRDQVSRRLPEERPTKSGLQTAVDDTKSATQTLSSDLKGLGKPDTEAGQQAKDSLDQLSTSLEQNVTTIETSLKNASGISGVIVPSHRRR